MFTAPEAYDRFMGRYSAPLAPLLADFAAVAKGQRVLDVGCGPGALTAELVARVGAKAVSAVDPSEPFVAAARGRHPGVDVRQCSAELLPFSDGAFDASLAQLVVHFMASPADGLLEMARVTRGGGVVAACVWDFTEGGGPLGHFWAAALNEVEAATLTVDVEHAGFDEWWEPFTLGVGPAGTYFGSLDAEHRERLREHCAESFPAGAFTVSARAWAARGVV